VAGGIFHGILYHLVSPCQEDFLSRFGNCVPAATSLVAVVVSSATHMALLPELHVNFGQVTFGRIYQIFMRLIPGSTLIGGLMLAYPASAATASNALGLGRYSRFAAVVCAVYIVGFVLYGLSVFVSANCSVALSNIVFKRWPPKRPNEVSSKSTVWRRVASEFLGPSLAPPVPLPPAPPLVGYDIE
jgi:hypothetical protein